jgi:hypothetical protein
VALSSHPRNETSPSLTHPYHDLPQHREGWGHTLQQFALELVASCISKGTRVVRWFTGSTNVSN